MKKAIKPILTSSLLFVSTQLFALDRTVAVGASIQSAIDAVSTSGGGTVTLAAGTHTITSTLKIRGNVTLQGSGVYASKIVCREDINMIEGYGEGMKNITFRNFEMIGVQTENSGGIQVTTQSTDNENISIINVRCYETGWGVHIKGCKNLAIENCDFSRNGNLAWLKYAHNLYLRRVTGAVVKNSIFTNSISSNGINISYSYDIEIYSCQMTGNYFRGVRAADTDGYKVHDCIVMNNGDVGILANTEVVVTTNIDIQNNCVSGNGVGIETKSGATGVCKNNNVVSNTTNFKLVSSVTQSGNTSDSKITCVIPSFSCDNNTLPAITLASSATTIESPGNVTLTATTLDDNVIGSIAKVDFYKGTILLGSDATFPYSLAVSNLAAGSYSFTAKATDNCLAATTSNAVAVTVFDVVDPTPCANNILPTISITSSAYSAVAPASVTITANVADADGVVRKVNFYQGSTLIKADVTSPFSAIASGLAPGNYTFSAKAVDTCDGTTTSDTISVCVNSLAKLEAECYNDMLGIQTEACSEGTQNVGYINNGDWILYSNVNLTGMKSLRARLSSKVSGASIEVRTGSITGTLLATLAVPNTAGNQNWVSDSVNLAAVTGVQNVYLVFKGVGTGYLFNINHFGFSANAKVVTGLQEANLSESINIYPNPFTQNFTIDLAENVTPKIEIYNALGQLVNAQTATSNQSEIDLSNEKTGVYVVKISTDNGVITKHIVKK